MGMTYQILGQAGDDNALFVVVDSGKAMERLLFDCGAGCPEELTLTDIQAVDHLFFSHFHMDHVGGFDTYFRKTFNRTARPNRIWGPPGAAGIMQHRFQGFLWNLTERMSVSWVVHDIEAEDISTTRFELAEAFAVAHAEGKVPRRQIIAEDIGFTVEAVTMNHRTPVLAYLVREKPHRNIDMSRVTALGLSPGPWLEALKKPLAPGTEAVVDGRTVSLNQLQKDVVIELPGESVAYLTDFLLDGPAITLLAESLAGCRTIVCEAQYRHADLALAEKNYHMTTVQSATLAERARAEELILVHLSERYRQPEWMAILGEARRIFPNARFPEHWNI